jgi:hypothetical protein
MTPENSPAIIWVTIAVVVLGIAGLASAGLVYLDISRRGLSGKERWLWPLVALLLPGFGLGVYFFIRLINTFLGGPADPGISRSQPVWVTRLRRPKGMPGPSGSPPVGKGTTIPAAEWMRPAGGASYGSNSGYRLVALSGVETGREFPLDSLPALIGRGAEVNIALDSDIHVSRKHAELYLQGPTLRIRDLNSAHGTQVNGFSIQDKGLEPGDRIEIGRTILEVVAE